MKINLFLSFVFLSLLLQVKNVDYLKNVQDWVDKVYQTIYSVGCWHKSPHPSTFDDIKRMKTINCASSVSITYQQAGLIDKGKLVSHTTGVKKNIISHYDVSNLQHSLELSVQNHKNLKKGTCDLVKVMKKYSDMPSWL